MAAAAVHDDGAAGRKLFDFLDRRVVSDIFRRDVHRAVKVVPIPETASRDIHDHEIRGLLHIVQSLFGRQSAEILLHVGISFL